MSATAALSSLAKSATSQAVGGLFGLASSLGGAKLQNKYYNQNLDKQVSISKDLAAYDMGLETEWQKWLLQNQASYEKNALKSAGINTAALNDGNFQLAATPSTSSSMPSGFAPNIDIMGSISQAMLAGAQTRELNARAAGQEKDNAHKDDWWDSQIDQAKANIRNLETNSDFTKVQTDAATAQLDYMQKAYSPMLQNLHLTNQQLDLQIQELDQHIENLKKDAILKDQEINFNTENMPLQLKYTVAGIHELETRGQLNQAKAHEAYAMVGQLNAMTQGIQLDNQYKNLTMTDRVALVGGEVKIQGYNIDSAEQAIDRMNRKLGTWSDQKTPQAKFQWLMGNIQEFSNVVAPFVQAGATLGGAGIIASGQRAAAVTRAAGKSAPAPAPASAPQTETWY